jgi:hypothetical protein
MVMRGGPGPEQPWLQGLEQQRNWIGGGSWLPRFGGGSASWLQQIMHPNTDALRGLHHAAVNIFLKKLIFPIDSAFHLLESSNLHVGKSHCHSGLQDCLLQKL